MINMKTNSKLIIKLLKKEYRTAHTALKYRTPFELLVSVRLSAQCTDERINKVTPELFKKYKNIYGFANAKQAILEKDIRSTGFYKHKAKSIISFSKQIIEEFNGTVPDSMENLIKLPGVARKTANIILSSCYKKAEGIAVDTHVARLSNRLGFSKQKDPFKIEQDLLKIVPKKYWLDFNYLLINHGRAVCDARKPLCENCFINKFCPRIGVKNAKKK
ncbi:endonuclease III [bacterium]